MQEVLVDPVGNVVSPAAAEQYSPPTPNAHFRRTDWIPPPPLPSFFAPTPPTAPPFLPPPMSFPTSSLVMMPMLYGQPWNSPYMGIPPQMPPAFPVPIPGGYPEPPRDPVDGLISVGYCARPPADDRACKPWVSSARHCGTAFSRHLPRRNVHIHLRQ